MDRSRVKVGLPARAGSGSGHLVLQVGALSVLRAVRDDLTEVDAVLDHHIHIRGHDDLQAASVQVRPVGDIGGHVELAQVDLQPTDLEGVTGRGSWETWV